MIVYSDINVCNLGVISKCPTVKVTSVLHNVEMNGYIYIINRTDYIQYWA